MLEDESGRFDFYGAQHARFAGALAREMRREVYGADIGQQGWRTMAEQGLIAKLLRCGPGRHVLDIACGPAGRRWRWSSAAAAVSPASTSRRPPSPMPRPRPPRPRSPAAGTTPACGGVTSSRRRRGLRSSTSVSASSQRPPSWPAAAGYRDFSTPLRERGSAGARGSDRRRPAAELDDLDLVAGAGRRRQRRADHQAVGPGEARQHRAVLHRERRRDEPA